MASEKITAMIRSLLERTKAGVLDWKDAGNGAYHLSFPSQTIRIRAAVDQLNSRTYVVEILNSLGELIETVRTGDVSNFSINFTQFTGNTSLYEIYQEARRKAVGADKAIDDILTALNK